MALKQHCAFLSVTYFIKITSSNELRDFIDTYSVTDLPVGKWQNMRKRCRTKLLLKSSYINSSKNGEQQIFLEHFSYANYMLMSKETRHQHTFKNCKKCQSGHAEIFQHFRANKIHLDKPTQSVHALLETTPTSLSKSDYIDLGKTIAKKFNEKMAETPHNITMESILKRKASCPNEVTKKVKRNIIKQARDSVQENLVETDFVALYSSYQSSAEWDRQRIDSHKAIRKSVKRTHSGPVHSYSFNEELLMDTLIKGHDAILNWTQLSKDVGLCTVKTGLWPKNGGQVRVKCICRKLFSFIITKYVQKIATHLF